MLEYTVLVNMIQSRDIVISALISAFIYLSFCPLPEITEEALEKEAAEAGVDPNVVASSFWRQYRCILGFVAQMAYVYVLLFYNR